MLVNVGFMILRLMYGIECQARWLQNVINYISFMPTKVTTLNHMCNYMLAVPAVSCGLRLDDASASSIRSVVFSGSLPISVNLVRNLRENPYLQ